ncbi:hypothetical protein IW262DRAFT_1458748 [Armillaria fumosa]|nr:hypothetical protein IW262DRAFT_1458748 [Armillaria fumosa]
MPLRLIMEFNLPTYRTRGRVRSLTLSTLSASSCDSTMPSRGSAGVKVKSGSSGSLWDPHALLAACNHRQSAREVDGQGIFTKALLKIMRKKPISELMYQSLIHRLVYASIMSTEWRHTLRRLFDSWEEPANSSMILCLHEHGQPHLVLHAGPLHGMTVGSAYEIFGTGLSDLRHPLHATVTTDEVETFTSLLVPYPESHCQSSKKTKQAYTHPKSELAFTTKFLQSLDDDLIHKHNIRDIVDTTPAQAGRDLSTNDMIKILTGGINRRVDNQDKHR